MNAVDVSLLEDMSFPDYQTLCNACIQVDWVDGLSYLRSEGKKSKHDWYWTAPSAKTNPGQALFRACQFAKPNCAKELIKEMPPETLLHALAMGSSNPIRPLRVTQNRIRCLSYLSKAFGALEEKERKKYLDGNKIAIKSVLDNQRMEVLKVFNAVWDASDVWKTLWKDSSYFLKDSVVQPSSDAVNWGLRVELMWQITGDAASIPDGVKEELLAVAQKNDNRSFLPLICTELSRKNIQEGLSDIIDKKVKRAGKKI